MSRCTWGVMGSLLCLSCGVEMPGATDASTDAGPMNDGDAGADGGHLDAGPGDGGLVDAGLAAAGVHDTTRGGCRGTAYSGPLPASASLSGLSFTPGTAQSYFIAALGVRYPIGKHIVETEVMSGGTNNCFAAFVTDTSSADAVLSDGSVIVHECGHMYDADL